MKFEMVEGSPAGLLKDTMKKRFINVLQNKDSVSAEEVSGLLYISDRDIRSLKTDINNGDWDVLVGADDNGYFLCSEKNKERSRRFVCKVISHALSEKRNAELASKKFDRLYSDNLFKQMGVKI